MHRGLERTHLFNTKRLDELIQKKQIGWIREVDELSDDAVLRGDHEAMAADLAERFCITVPTLKEDAIEVAQEEANIDMSGDPERAFFGDRGPVMVRGTLLTFSVPFEGDGEVLLCQASTHSLNPPRGSVRGGSILFPYFTSDHDGEGIKRAVEQDVANVKQALEWANTDVRVYNTDLRVRIVQQLAARREKLGKDRSLVESLGFRVRRRADAPETFTTPAVTRKVIARPLRGLPGPKPAEPTLESAEYDHILRVCSSMAKLMERSPRVFAHMDEESIRLNFLLQLNGQYEGGATGETFNGEGKTDILVRVEDRNVFIAECKFWTGPKSLVDAIDQLLGYATWRDSKTAIFLFNRGRRLTTVLAQVPGAVKEHAAFVRQVDYGVENAFQFVLKRLDDPARELLMTVMVFEVPAEYEATAGVEVKH